MIEVGFMRLWPKGNWESLKTPKTSSTLADNWAGGGQADSYLAVLLAIHRRGGRAPGHPVLQSFEDVRLI